MRPSTFRARCECGNSPCGFLASLNQACAAGRMATITISLLKEAASPPRTSPSTRGRASSPTLSTATRTAGSGGSRPRTRSAARPHRPARLTSSSTAAAEIFTTYAQQLHLLLQKPQEESLELLLEGTPFLFKEATAQIGNYFKANESFIWDGKHTAQLEHGQAGWWGAQGGAANNNRMMMIGCTRADFSSAR